jgi:recombination protein RecA
MYAEGISKVGDILDLSVELDLIEKRGSFYSYGDLRLAQGRENAKDFLRENPDLAEEIEAAIREGLLPPPIMPL